MSKIKKATVEIVGTVLKLAFSHGEELSCDVNDLPNEQKQNLLMHGFKQKVTDSYAGSATPAEAQEKASAVINNLIENNWSSRGTGEGGVRVTQLARALAMATGRDIEEAVEIVSEMDDATKKALGNKKAIKLEIAKIQAERAAEALEAAEESGDEGPDIDELLQAKPATDEEEGEEG